MEPTAGIELPLRHKAKYLVTLNVPAQKIGMLVSVSPDEDETEAAAYARACVETWTRQMAGLDCEPVQVHSTEVVHVPAATFAVPERHTSIDYDVAGTIVDMLCGASLEIAKSTEIPDRRRGQVMLAQDALCAAASALGVALRDFKAVVTEASTPGIDR